MKRLVALLSLVAITAIGAGCVPTAPDAPNAMDRLLELVNRSRAEHGLAPLESCGTLADAALAHSQDMATHNFLGHTGSDGSQPWDRAVRHGYASTFVGENAARGQPSVEGVFLAWMNSPAHRDIILSPAYEHAGAAWAGGYWTQDFGAGGVCS